MKPKKRLISWILLLAMLLSIFPAAAFAETEAEAKSITVYVTLSMNGEPINTSDTDKPILYLPVEVPLSGEEATIDDTLISLHDQFFTGGSAAGYASNATGFITRLWGQNTSSCGYYLDNKAAQGTGDAVKNGSYLAIFFYMDIPGWRDIYAKFNKPDEIKSNENYEFELINVKTSGAVEGAKIYTGTDITELTDTGKMTDADGKVTLSFDTPEEYHVVAKNPSIYLTPAHCLVNVTPGMSDEERRSIVDQDLAALSVAYEGTDIALPDTGASGETSITWQSNNPDVITNNGRVAKQAQEETVTLTATVSYGTVSDTKPFNITIPALTPQEITEQLDAAVSKIGTSTLRPSEWDATFTQLKDTNILELLRSKYGTVAPSVRAAISDTKDQTQIDEFGNIIYGESPVSSKDVDFRLYIGDSERIITLKVTVAARQKTKQELLDYNADPILLSNLIKSKNSDLENITSGLSLKTSSSDYYIAIAWSSDHAAISPTGSVTRPFCGQDDIEVKLTAKLRWDGMGGYMNAPGPIPKEKTVVLTVTVKAFSQSEYDAAIPEVQAALASVTADKIKLMGESSAADLSKVTYDLSLPSASGTGVATTWSADDFEGITVNTYRGKVIRPQIGQSDISGKIKVTVSKAGYSESKEFDITVSAISQAEADVEQQRMNAVKNALIFDVIKGNNAAPYLITDNIKRVYRGFADENNSVTWATSNTGEKGIEISWESDNLEIFTQFASFNKPSVATPVTLTATLKSIRLASVVAEEQVKFDLIAVPDTSKIGNLLEDLAGKAKYNGIPYVESSSEWAVFDLAAYGDFYAGTAHKSTTSARQSYINNVIEKLGKSDAGANDLAKGIIILKSIGVDASKLYAYNPSSGLYNLKVDAAAKLKGMDFSGTSYYAAPYILLAGQQGVFQLSEAQIKTLLQLVEDAQGDGLFDDMFGENPDFAGSVLSALSPYYLDSNDTYGIKADVKAIVDKALNALSAAQDTSGSFGNANSDAFVATGLVALGLDPDSDARFVKEGKTLLDGLLSYKNSDEISFQPNDLATEQAFRALISILTFKYTGESYNIYDHSGKPSLSAKATGSGQVQPLPNPTSPEKVTVQFILKGLDNNDNEQTWLSKSISVPSDASVAYAIIKALENSGFTQKGAESGYIYEITNPSGRTLGEQQGDWPNSGWLYKLNNALQSQGITEQTISKNDKILLYYTKDWTKDPDAGKKFGQGSGLGNKEETVATAEIPKKASANSQGVAETRVGTSEVSEALDKAITAAKKANDGSLPEVKILVEIASSATALNTTTKAEAIKAIAKEDNARFTIESPLGTMTFNNTALDGLVKGVSDDADIVAAISRVDTSRLTEEQKKAVGDNPVFDLSVSAGGEVIHDFNGTVTVFLPYALKNNEDSKALTVYFLGENGKLEQMENVRYDAARKGYVFTASHFSLFMIAKAVGLSEEMPFSDVNSADWFYDAVKYTLHNGLMNGVSDTLFDPKGSITRAMLVTMLYRCEGEPEPAGPNPFDDVVKGQWYANAVIWASEKGIVDGYGNGLFGTNDNITREQIATLLMRYANWKNYNINKANELSSFTDAGQVSLWALNGMKWANAEGLITGRTATMLAPKGTASRAEAATLLMRFTESNAVQDK